MARVLLRLLILGTLFAPFFSSTFILNRAISLEGGHWGWTASLRYGWMLAFLCGGLLLPGISGWLGILLTMVGLVL